MRSFPAASPFGDVGVVPANGLVLQNLQLYVKPLQFLPYVLDIHVGQCYFANIRITVVTCQRTMSVCVLIKEKIVVSTVELSSKKQLRFKFSNKFTNCHYILLKILKCTNVNEVDILF